MISALFKGLFNLVLKLFNLILSPFISAITSLFPSISTYFVFITSFLSSALSYVGVILDLLFIPRGALSLLFDYFITCYSIYLIALGVKFFINIYNKFKI